MPKYYGIRHKSCNPGSTHRWVKKGIFVTTQSTHSSRPQPCYFIIIKMALWLHLRQQLNLLRQQEQIIQQQEQLILQQLDQLPLEPEPSQEPSQELPRTLSPPAEGTHHLDRDRRLQTRTLRDAGHTYTEIASQLKITKRQAQWAITAPSSSPRRRSGRPSLMTEAQAREFPSFLPSFPYS